MARMSDDRLRVILNRATSWPSVFVETGTYKGKTTRLALAHFADVRTIEIHEKNYREAVEYLVPLGVRCYHGDSAEVLPTLAREIRVPVCFFLDAHWGKRAPDLGGQDRPLPLWVELDAIAARGIEGDVVIVDDVHSFGQSEPTREWEDVSLGAIVACFRPERVRDSLILFDHAVVYL